MYIEFFKIVEKDSNPPAVGKIYEVEELNPPQWLWENIMFNIIRMIQTKSESRRLSADQLFYGGKISSVSFFTGFNAEEVAI